MRRLLALSLLLVAAAAVLVGAAGDPAGSASYRVDAVFDRTAALIPGQKVKIAGAPVGEVKDIGLTRERKARVEMEIQEGFAPFRANATCTIRAEALIGEKFVQCEPGTPGNPELRDGEGGVPTVQLAHTTVPVEIDTILSTFRRPYRERFRILLNEFGIGLAGRSDDLDAAIRRANPALQQANKLLRILDREKRSLGRLVDGSDAALAELAARRGEVQGVIEHANAVGQAIASRRDALGESIRRLPPLLAEVEPSAEQLSSLAREATPAVRRLRAAAPNVNALLRDVAPLSDAAVPALERLSRTARIGRRAIKPALPVARRLRLLARELPDVVKTADELVQSLRNKGGIENLLTGIYYAAAAAARFDSVSHVLPAFGVVNSCIGYAESTDPSCDGHFSGGRTAAKGRAGSRSRERAGGGRPGAERQRPGPTAAPAPRAQPQTPGRRRPRLPEQLGSDVERLLQNLLDLPRLNGPQRDREESGIPLLDYLLR